MENQEFAKILAAAGAYIETTSSKPYFYAIEHKNATLFQWLMDMGVRLDGYDENGKSVYARLQEMPDHSLLQLLHIHLAQLSLEKAQEPIGGKQSFDFNAVEEWIKKNMHKKLTVQKISAFCGVDISKLNGEFKRRTNMSVPQYIDVLRMEEVRRLVFCKNKSFAAAIQKVGLRIDVDTFINRFREMYGVSLPKSAVSADMFVDKKIATAIKRAANWLAEHYKEPYNYQKTVEVSGLERSVFSRYFKRIMDVAPVHYLNQLRLKLYRKYISEEGKTVLEAAQEVGFNSRQRIYEQMPRRLGETGARKLDERLAQKLEEAKVWLQNNYATPRPIEKLSEQTGLSIRAFAFFFKQINNQTPLQFLQNVQVKVAHALIKEGVDADEAARKAGFKKRSDFRVLYKQTYNETPWKEHAMWPKTRDGVKRMADWLRAHYKEPYDSHKMVEISGIPPSRVARSFKRATGELPNNFHRRLRYEEVLRLVKQEGVSFKAACKIAGFKGNQYKKFRSIYGSIPTPDREGRC